MSDFPSDVAFSNFLARVSLKPKALLTELSNDGYKFENEIVELREALREAREQRAEAIVRNGTLCAQIRKLEQLKQPPIESERIRQLKQQNAALTAQLEETQMNLTALRLRTKGIAA